MKHILIAMGVVAALVVVTLFQQYTSAYNYGNRAENQIVSQYENMENVLAQYGQKIKEAAQVTTMQRDDLIAIFTGTLDARYGEDGSQAAMQWIQEQNPTLDPGTYANIQRMIEAGRNNFEKEQTKLVSIKQEYRSSLGYLWRGTMLSVAGYPIRDVGFRGGPDEFPIISTNRAKKTFADGVETGTVLD